MRKASWSRAFEDPVPGLKTLLDAANYIQKLPKAEQELPHWQQAVFHLIAAAEDREPLMFARIGMLKALSHGKPKPPAESRKKRAKAYRIITNAKARQRR